MWKAPEIVEVELRPVATLAVGMSGNNCISFVGNNAVACDHIKCC